jgi:hypothetical protein
MVLWTEGDWLRTFAGHLRHRLAGPATTSIVSAGRSRR